MSVVEKAQRTIDLPALDRPAPVVSIVVPGLNEAESLPLATTIEQGLIPARMRDRGFRLACQHDIHDDLTLHLSAGTLATADKFPNLKHDS